MHVYGIYVLKVKLLFTRLVKMLIVITLYTFTKMHYSRSTIIQQKMSHIYDASYIGIRSF